MTIEENVPLAPLTSFKIGGPARFFVPVETTEELQKALSFAKERGLAVLILGGGSNVLIDDAGWGGLVIKIEITGIERDGQALIAGAGESWDALVARAVGEGLWGLENLSGIPGSVGGAVVGGIGAYGAAVGQHLVWVEALDLDGTIQRMTNTECAFGYRSSFFKNEAGRYIVLRAAFELSTTPAPELSYKDLAGRFREGIPSLAAIREAVLAIRSGKFPDLAVEGTAGSFFKNPIVSAKEAEALTRRYPAMPVFSMPETDGIKVPLAWLLDHVLALKGTCVGGARLFERQPLVIAATAGASAADVRTLAQMVEKKVKEEFNILIEREVHVVE
jgi:UDP-N-acetylmuramate dehydrogenase